MTDLINELNNFIADQINADQFSGAILLVKNGKTMINKVSGYSNKEKGIFNQIDTKFNIGSMNKMFTGVAIAQLAEQEKIFFNDPIDKYISNIIDPVTRKITINQILTHTEGFSSYFNKKYINIRSNLKSIDDYLELFINEPLLFKPGEKYQYSNSGYVVLGAIIEKVTKETYYSYVKNHIFIPSDMENTDYYELNQKISNLASGYTYRLPYSKETSTGPRRDNDIELPQKGSPAGGGYSTCHDLYNFSQNLLQNKLLSSHMTDEIFTPRIEVGTKNNETLYYGYGFQILKSRGHVRYGHAGVMAGVNGRLDIYPDIGYTVVVLSNYDEPSAFKIANEAGKLILS